MSTREEVPDECDVCSYSAVHHSWPPEMSGATHCRRCHRSWSSRREAHCPIVGCCRHFSTDAAAQLHKRSSPDGERVWCVDPASMVRKATETRPSGPVFELRDEDVWGEPISLVDRERLANLARTRPGSVRT